MNVLLCIILFGAGHCVRDGWPATGHTHIARVLGAFLCALGAFLIQFNPLDAEIVFAAVGTGFYFDMKHGDGQGADNLKSYAYLLLSGITSLIPAAIAFYFYKHYIAYELAIVGALKPPLWGLSWKLLRNYQQTWFQPTRIAAIVFGMLFATVICFI